MSDYIGQNQTFLSFNDSSNWVIVNKVEQSIKQKIEKHGIPLGNWNLNINRGILTGYNDAFVIDQITKDLLIESEPKTADLIRPILRGKDIFRYTYKFSNLWIICIPCGFTNSRKGTNSGEDWFKKTYPSIYSYLINTEEQLAKIRKPKSKGLYKRDDQGDYWWELRSCKYLDDFNKQKLMYSEIVKEPHFYLDEEGTYYPEATTFVMTGKDLQVLLFYLNSDITFSIFKFFYAGGGLGSNGIRYKKAFLNNLVLPKITNEVRDYFATIYASANKSTGIIISKTLQRKIDYYIGKLYNLTDDEITYLLDVL